MTFKRSKKQVISQLKSFHFIPDQKTVKILRTLPEKEFQNSLSELRYRDGKIWGTRPLDQLAADKARQRAKEIKADLDKWAMRALVSFLIIKYFVELEDGESPSPPRFFEFLLFLLPIRQRDHVVGDLEEEFRSVTVPKYGKRFASTVYAWQVLIEITRAVITGVRGVAFGWIFAKLSK